MREHGGRSLAWLGIVLGWLMIACGAESARVSRRAPGLMEFILVPRPPPVVPVEVQPPPPSPRALWIEGSWSWQAGRWRWNAGGWVLPPAGASRSSWTWSYQADGQVRFWAAAWFGPDGREIEAPATLAAARSRIDRR